MPIVEIHVLDGYGPADKARLGRAVTRAVRSVVPAGPEAVTVMTHEYPAENYQRGGLARSPAPALPDPEATVLSFLQAMEARDLETAETYLGVGFVMHFPGAGPMTTLPQLVAWSKPRYRFVKKTYDRFDTCPSDDAQIVYCYGSLHGEWPDGTAFDGIRFIDRFELSDGLIVRQDVWNDIAEVGP